MTNGALIPVLAQCKQLMQNTISATKTVKAFLSLDPSGFISQHMMDSLGNKEIKKYMVITPSGLFISPLWQ
jgi:hypothetical protein